MSKWIKAVLIVLAIWLVVFGAGGMLFSAGLNLLPRFVNIGGGSHRDEHMETYTGDMTNIEEINIQTRNGRIRLIGDSAATQITVTATYVARDSSQARAEERLSNMKTVITTEGNTLRVKADFGSESVNNQSISYEITLPTDVNVVADTSNGSIEVSELTGDLRLDTSNGEINVHSAVGPSRIVAETSNGRIVVSANPTGGRYQLETSNGSIIVRIPDQLGVDVMAGTSNGSVDLGPGQWTITGGKISTKNVSAQRGDGALELRLDTSNGSIKVEKP